MAQELPNLTDSVKELHADNHALHHAIVTGNTVYAYELTMRIQMYLINISDAEEIATMQMFEGMI